MKRFSLSSGKWKIVLSMFTLFAALILGTENWHGLPALSSGVVGSLGVRTTPAEGPQLRRVLSLQPWSPLNEAGVEVGDFLVPDRFHELKRWHAVGEAVGLTVVRRGQTRHLFITTVPRPLTRSQFIEYVSASIECWIGLLFALVIGLTRPDGRSCRALALAFIFVSMNLPPYFSPAGWWADLESFVFYMALTPGWYLLLYFAIHYPDEMPQGLRARLARALPIYLALCVAAVGVGVQIGMGNVFVLQSLYLSVAIAIGMLGIMAAFFDGWRHSAGETRQRYAWLLASFALFMIPAFATFLQPALPAPVLDTLQLSIAEAAGRLLMFVGLGYAVVRLHVFNFGFAVNRALVYSVTSLILLVMFGLLEWAAHHLLDFRERQKSVLLDGAIALGLYLSFHRVRHVVEHHIERVFFKRWHDNESALRLFVRQAAHMTSGPALLGAFESALQRFTGGARSATYRRSADASYESRTGCADMPTIGADDPIAVALRTDSVPTLAGGLNRAGWSLALPMSHRGELHGFALIGARPDGAQYRPDELSVLGFAAHQVGLDYHALRTEELERQIAVAERDADTLRAQLRTATEMRTAQLPA